MDGISYPFERVLTHLAWQVLVISTDYRDLRKAAYQEYVVAFDYNTVRLPSSISPEEGATLGVAFVAAALALGVCMGVDFSGVLDGPDLFSLVRQIGPGVLPDDVRQECLSGILGHERATSGDWLAIWGGKSNSPSYLGTLPTLRFSYSRHRILNLSKPYHPAGQAGRSQNHRHSRQSQARPAPRQPQRHPHRPPGRQPRPQAGRRHHPR